LFSVLMCFIVFYVFVFFVLSYVSSAPSEDSVRFRCWGDHIPYLDIFFVKFFAKGEHKENMSLKLFKRKQTNDNGSCQVHI